MGCISGICLRTLCHLHTHFFFSPVQHPFFSSSLSRLGSHLCKKWSAISLALGFRYRTVCTHFEACELQPLVLVRSSSLFSAHLHFVQGVVSVEFPSCIIGPCTSMTHSPSFSCRDTFSWVSSFWMPVSFCWSSIFVFSSSSNWDYVSPRDTVAKYSFSMHRINKLETTCDIKIIVQYQLKWNPRKLHVFNA